MKTYIIHLSSNEENERNNISSYLFLLLNKNRLWWNEEFIFIQKLKKYIFNLNIEYIYEIKSFYEEIKFLSDNNEIKEKWIF
jgi:archaellum biogenesis ATPase FlaH